MKMKNHMFFILIFLLSIFYVERKQEQGEENRKKNLKTNNKKFAERFVRKCDQNIHDCVVVIYCLKVKGNKHFPSHKKKDQKRVSGRIFQFLIHCSEL